MIASVPWRELSLSFTDVWRCPMKTEKSFRTATFPVTDPPLVKSMDRATVRRLQLRYALKMSGVAAVEKMSGTTLEATAGMLEQIGKLGPIPPVKTIMEMEEGRRRVERAKYADLESRLGQAGVQVDKKATATTLIATAGLLEQIGAIPATRHCSSCNRQHRIGERCPSTLLTVEHLPNGVVSREDEFPEEITWPSHGPTQS
jgi:hypothetical protein